jgi:hypothetical protein
MVRWAVVPLFAFALAFLGSLAYFELDDEDTSRTGWPR